jgi:hypothetical protein
MSIELLPSNGCCIVACLRSCYLTAGLYVTLRSYIHNILIYCGVYATNKTGSSSDDWIYYQVVTHSLINYTYSMAIQFISRLHTS